MTGPVRTVLRSGLVELSDGRCCLLLRASSTSFQLRSDEEGRRDRWGYGRITVAHRRYSVHRLSAALFLGFDLASPPQILHRCHNPACFRPDHLRPGTHEENLRDRRQRFAARNG